jgi:plastocyanin
MPPQRAVLPRGSSVARNVAVAACTCAALTGAASAADLTVKVLDKRGSPAAQAVVLVRPASGTPAAPAATTSQITQQFQAFAPEVLPVAVGTTVRFPNLDRMRHHVYSFSPAHTFEIRLYSGEQIPQVQFDNPGIVAIGCNIHDWMQGYIYVTDAPFFATTDATGTATLRGLPSGEFRLAVWHPELPAEVEAARTSVGASSNTATLTLDAAIEPLTQDRGSDDPLLTRFQNLHRHE